MKKAINVIVFFAVLLTAVSARTERIFMASEGHLAPELRLNADQSTSEDSALINLADLRGKYVLLNFWATTDAESRIAAKNYDALIAANPDNQIRHVAVNIDRSERLFREIIRRDGLDATTQHHAGAESALKKVASSWHLENGLRAFLIDPKGTIIAVNPTAETLATISLR